MTCDQGLVVTAAALARHAAVLTERAERLTTHATDPGAAAAEAVLELQLASVTALRAAALDLTEVAEGLRAAAARADAADGSAARHLRRGSAGA